jgi:RecA-family ATPase
MQMANKEELYRELERGKVLAIEIETDSRNALLARATTALSRITVQPDNVKALVVENKGGKWRTRITFDI